MAGWMPTPTLMEAAGFTPSGVAGGFYWKSLTGGSYAGAFWVYVYLLPKRGEVFIHQLYKLNDAEPGKTKALATKREFVKLVELYGWTPATQPPTNN